MRQVRPLLVDLAVSTKFDRLLTNLHKPFLLSANLFPPSNPNGPDIYGSQAGVQRPQFDLEQAEGEWAISTVTGTTHSTKRVSISSGCQIWKPVPQKRSYLASVRRGRFGSIEAKYCLSSTVIFWTLLTNLRHSGKLAANII